MDSIWIAIITMSILSLIFGSLLGYASHHFKVEIDPFIEQIDAILPQIQCGQCGYPGCLPYAEAIINDSESINKCTPGGKRITLKLASLLNIDIQLIDDNENVKSPVNTLAWIDESNCIGCTKCIQICPIDAIIGTAHSIHTVLSDICTGCDLCAIACPTNCIEMHPVTITDSNRKLDLQNL